SSLLSDWVNAPVTAYRRMCVSRLSMPVGARGQDVALDPQLVLEYTDQLGRLCADRDELRHRPAALRDDDALLVNLVEDGQAVLLELRRRHLLHSHMVTLVILDD